MNPQARSPKSIDEWIGYISKLNLKIGIFIFNPFEIQNAILRAAFGPPSYFGDYCNDIVYPFYSCDDPKINLKYRGVEPVINFGFYAPFKSNSKLRIFSSNNVFEELKELAEDCFVCVNFGKNLKKIKFPGVMEYYEEDFHGDKSAERFITCVQQCLPSTANERYSKAFNS